MQRRLAAATCRVASEAYMEYEIRAILYATWWCSKYRLRPGCVNIVFVLYRQWLRTVCLMHAASIFFNSHVKGEQ